MEPTPAPMPGRVGFSSPPRDDPGMNDDRIRGRRHAAGPRFAGASTIRPERRTLSDQVASTGKIAPPPSVGHPRSEPPMSSVPTPARIVSMDQFRGYTVAGMFLVNFVGGLGCFPEVLKHHNDHPYFSYADTIMPSFMFAAGFSLRLTTLRRLGKQGPLRTYGHIALRRSEE